MSGHRGNGARAGQRTFLLFAIVLLATACGGGGGDRAEPTPSCTAMLPGPDGSPTPSPTPCVVGATEQPTDSPGESEVWEGTVSGMFEQPLCTTSTFSGTIQMTVAGDGTVTGSGTTITSAYTCENGASIPETSITYEFSGTATNGGFTLDFPDGYLVILSPTAEDQVMGTVVDDAGGGYVSTTTLTLDCLSCGEAVG